MSTTGNAGSHANSELTPTLSVNAANPADVTFTVTGLASGYKGAVTFTDSTGNSDVAPIGGNGTYSANLSNLADGTLTYLMTVSNAAGNVIKVDPTATLGDGSANAPAGTAQFPNLLSGYAVRPSWMVAGVDYAVGIPTGTALNDPSTINIPGVSVNTSTHQVSVNASNVTISGIDFSRDGGWQLIIGQWAAANNLTVTDSNFAIGANGNPMVNQINGSNTTFKYDVFNGNGLPDNLAGTVFLLNQGMTLEYSLVENAYGDFIDYGTNNLVEFNAFYNGGTGLSQGAHPDWLQLGNATYNSEVFKFNTFYQPNSSAGTLGLGFAGWGTWSLGTFTASNNTFVNLAGSKVSYDISATYSPYFGNNGYLTGAGYVQNNYFDATGLPSASDFFTQYGTLQTGASITESGNVNMVTGGSPTQSGPQINTTSTITSLVESPTSGALDAGKTVTLTLNLSEAVTVAGGTPTLTLNDGGTATYTGGSGSNALTFSYTVGAGQNTSALAATAVNLNSATVTDGAGNAADLSLTGLTQTGPQIDTTTPTISSLVESPASGDLNAGNTVTLTVKLSEAVIVAGGTPTLTLNDGGTASYTGGSGSNALTFSYTVAAGQNTSGLAATAVNLNSATVTDGAGNAANLSLTGLTQTGPQIDTTTPTAPKINSVSESPATGDLNAGKVVMVTLDVSETVTVNTTSGTPTLTLNDGGTATYTGGSGSNALSFSYTVAAGQNTSALAATAVTLNSATITDAAGNAAHLSLSGLTQSGPQIDTTPPPAPIITSDKVIGKRVVLRGTEAENGTAITIYGGTSMLGTTTTGTNGTWVYTTGPLAKGAHVFTATATDAADNVSAPSSPYDPNIGGIHSASIAVMGNYMASSFALAADGHGSTVVIAETAQSNNQSLLSNPHHA